MKRTLKYLRLVWFILLYLLVAIYTFLFPTTASWFLFYAFTLWMVLSFLSTRQSFHLTHTEKSKHTDNTLSLAFTLQNKRRLPFFLSSVKVTLTLNDIQQTVTTSILFSKEIETTFHSIVLPRGHHETLRLDIEGYGLFGIWAKRSRLIVPINIDVYPEILTKSRRSRLIHRLAPYFAQPSRSLDHDYFMNDIRSFQNRDSLAGIDWKTSLKRGQWMVKEYETEEESPVALYFLGFDTDSFEELLSLTYTLVQEFKSNQKINLYLIGKFEDATSIQRSQESFLTIEPDENRKEIITLSQSVQNTHSRNIIVKSHDIRVPSPLNSQFKYQFIDEDTLLESKGGQIDSGQY